MPKPRAVHRKARYQRSTTHDYEPFDRVGGGGGSDASSPRLAGQSYLNDLVASVPPSSHRRAPTLSSARPLNTRALIEELIYYNSARSP